MISEKKYPTLLWSSYRPNLLPENIQIECFDNSGLIFLEKNIAFRNFFSLLGFDYYQGHTLETRMKKEKALPSFQPHRNLYLKDELFKKVDSDANFRNKMFENRNLVPSGSGTIAFKNGGSYLYRILGPEDSQVYKKGNFTTCEIPERSKYYAVAFFIEGTLAGFEEGVILPNGSLTVNQNGYYQPFQEVGQFISFTIISLVAYFASNIVSNKTLKPNEGLNQTSQPIHFLS